jgi:hypothetical protein
MADAFGVPDYARATTEVLDAIATWPECAADAGLAVAEVARISDDIARFDPRAA